MGSGLEAGPLGQGVVEGEGQVFVSPALEEQLAGSGVLEVYFQAVAVGVGEVDAALADVVHHPLDGDAVGLQGLVGFPEGLVAADAEGDVNKPGLPAAKGSRGGQLLRVFGLGEVYRYARRRGGS